MPLSGLIGNFHIEKFLDYIKNNYIINNEEIRILAYVTDLSHDDLFDSISRFSGFPTISHGDIVEVKIQKTKIDIGDENAYSIYYCYYDHSNFLLLCFTSDTLEEIGKTMDKFVNYKNNIFPLWINPFIFDKIRNQIIRNYTNTIISEFHASRYRINNDEKVTREHYNRYFRYLSDDGKYTLDELSRIYGVLPTSILFNIPNLLKFRITNMGKFTYIHGNVDILFNIINDILTIVLETKSIIDKSKIESVLVNMGKKQILLRRVIPVDIEFSREIDFTEIKDILENMNSEDYNFEIFDMLLIPGSIHLSGTIIDKNKNIAFNITGNSNKITLSPRKNTTFDSIMQFYKMIAEKLDVMARVSISS